MIARRTFLVAALATTACARLRDPVAGQFQVGSGYTVKLPQDWTDFSEDLPYAVRLLTRNGLAVDRLYLGYNLSGPDNLRDVVDKAAPRIRAGMSEADLCTYVAVNVRGLGYVAPVVANVRPQAFGAGTGVRLDLTTKTGDGLEVDGTALVIEQRGKMQLILFLAAREHYFATMLPEIEATMASAILR